MSAVGKILLGVNICIPSRYQFYISGRHAVRYLDSMTHLIPCRRPPKINWLRWMRDTPKQAYTPKHTHRHTQTHRQQEAEEKDESPNNLTMHELCRALNIRIYNMRKYNVLYTIL